MKLFFLLLFVNNSNDFRSMRQIRFILDTLLRVFKYEKVIWSLFIRIKRRKQRTSLVIVFLLIWSAAKPFKLFDIWNFFRNFRWTLYELTNSCVFCDAGKEGELWVYMNKTLNEIKSIEWKVCQIKSNRMIHVLDGRELSIYIAN